MVPETQKPALTDAPFCEPRAVPGAPGYADGVGASASFNEPSGLALSPDGGTLYIADTNNGAIRLLDTATSSVTTLDVSASSGEAGAAPVPRLASPPLPLAPPLSAAGGALPGATVVRFSGAPLSSPSGIVEARVELADGYKLTKGAPSRFAATVEGPGAGGVEIRGAASGDLATQREPGVARVEFARSGGGAATVINSPALL